MKELSARNQAAYYYATLCEADTTGLLPRDEITVRNNAIVRRVREQLERGQSGSLAAVVAALAARLK